MIARGKDSRLRRWRIHVSLCRVKVMNGKQAGDPSKLARALIQLADSDEPPLRWIAGSDVVAADEQKAKTLLAQIEAHRELSTSLAHEDAAA